MHRSASFGSHAEHDEQRHDRLQRRNDRLAQDLPKAHFDHHHVVADELQQLRLRTVEKIGYGMILKMIKEPQGEILAEACAGPREQIESDSGQHAAREEKRDLQGHDRDENRGLLSENALVEKGLKQQRRRDIGHGRQQQDQRAGDKGRAHLPQAPPAQAPAGRW